MPSGTVAAGNIGNKTLFKAFYFFLCARERLSQAQISTSSLVRQNTFS
jgi:hypothetical protein